MASLRYDLFPNQRLRAALENYIEHRNQPGDFLTAVICNDLREACGRADDINRHILFEIVSWFYNEAPSPCWGSEAKMVAWLAGES